MRTMNDILDWLNDYLGDNAEDFKVREWAEYMWDNDMNPCTMSEEEFSRLMERFDRGL